MTVRAKYVIIDRRNRREGTYRKETHEEDFEDGAPTDPLELGQAIHDRRYGPKDRRWFVKVLGVEES
jgi:hypothetical protein